MIDRVRLPRLFSCALVGATLLLASCASTTIQSTWSDPAFTGGPFKKVFVMGLSARNVTSRRVFEDIMVAKLQAAGVQAVPAYQFIEGDAQADEPAMHAAVARSGADALLMSRLLGVETQTTVSPMMVPGPGMGMGFGVGMGPGWYGAYSGWYAAPQVTQYQIARAETLVFDVRTQRLVWTGTSETFNPTSVQQEAPGLANAVIGALQARGLIERKSSSGNGGGGY